MKTKTLLAMGLCAAIGLVTSHPNQALAQEHHEHKEGDGANVKVPDTLEDMFGRSEAAPHKN